MSMKAIIMGVLLVVIVGASGVYAWRRKKAADARGGLFSERQSGLPRLRQNILTGHTSVSELNDDL